MFFPTRKCIRLNMFSTTPFNTKILYSLSNLTSTRMKIYQGRYSVFRTFIQKRSQTFIFDYLEITSNNMASWRIAQFRGGTISTVRYIIIYIKVGHNLIVIENNIPDGFVIFNYRWFCVFKVFRDRFDYIFVSKYTLEVNKVNFFIYKRNF